jgi:hypothetical protein
MSDGTGARPAAGAELEAVEDEWARAIVSNDAARIGAFMADDWVMVSESGVTTKEQFLSVVGSGALTGAPHRAGDEHGALRRQAVRRRRVDDGRVRAPR